MRARGADTALLAAVTGAFAALRPSPDLARVTIALLWAAVLELTAPPAEGLGPWRRVVLGLVAALLVADKVWTAYR